MTHSDPPEDAPVRPFADWLREQSRGASHDELSIALCDLTNRVRETGKKGSLQFTVSVAPLKGEVDALVVTDEIKLRLPEHDRKASLFYPDEFGNLQRTDPNQLPFESLREVGETSTGREVVDTKTGEIREVRA